jgi:hypothetical protein
MRKIIPAALLLFALCLACRAGSGFIPRATPFPPTATEPPSPPVVLPTATTAPVATVPPASVVNAIFYNNPRKYRVEFSSTLSNRGFTPDRLYVYLPRPVEWDGQQGVVIEDISPRPAKQGMDPVFGNGLLYWDLLSGWPGSGQSLEYRVVFSFTAYATTAQINPQDVRPYDPADPLVARYTRPEPFIESTDPQIVAIATSVAAGETNPYFLAGRLYHYVVDNAHYALVGRGLLGAKALLDNGEGECGDFSALFIALARARGIPARPVVGYWAISGKNQTHVWAEFYLEGIGWVPVDPTIGQQSDAKEAYYFGSMDNQRVILEKGFNIPLDPPAPDGYLAPLMQGPYWWYWGSGGGSMALDVTGWTITSIP